MTEAPAMFPRWLRLSALALAAAGLVATAGGLAVSPARTWPNLLLANVYLLSVALSGAVFLSMQYLSGAGWSAVLRRIAESLMCALPVAAALMLVSFFGWPTLYPWAAPSVWAGMAMLPSRRIYFSVPLVFVRMAVILGLWLLPAYRIRARSIQQDRGRADECHRGLIVWSAIFVVVFAPTFGLASVDWIMSREPEWTSTIFAVYVFAGLLVSGVAALTLVAIALRALGPMRGIVTAAHLHDLGKLLLAFSTFWAYIWLSQYLLIWYANLPGEISHYLRRTDEPWMRLFLFNLFVNWVAPCALLLSRAAKRSAATLTVVCVVLLFGHWLDLYLLIMPASWRAPRVGILELLIPLGYLGLVVLVMSRALAQALLLPRYDPYLSESLNHQT